ncbi:class I SAM-dependent methyltransferase [Thermodesulfobacteriota bacterium B35]
MCAVAVNMTYEPFSKEPEYVEANRAFIATLPLGGVRTLLDLACGTGVMTDLLVEACPHLRRILGLDLSLESMLIAARHFREQGTLARRGIRLQLLQGTADILPVADGCMDAVIMGNSIHMLPDERHLLREVARVLRPGGLFAFNSSFWAGTMPPGTEKVHHEWVKQAAVYLMNRDRELRRRGKPGIRRKRGTAKTAFSRPWLSIGDWQDRLDEAGFAVQAINRRTVLMDRRCFETIGAYAGLASVLFSGYPVQLASEALQETAGSALAAMGVSEVPRLWLEITAARKETV